VRLRWVAVAGAILLLGAPNAMAGAAGNWSGTDLAFGTHTASTTSGSQTVTISNADALPHTISGLSIDGANPGAFSLSNDQCTGLQIAPLVGTCTVDVTFSPSSVGADTAAIEVTDETGTTTGGVSDLSGTGTSPMSLPGSVSFGSQNLGTTSSNSVTLSNTGNATFNVTGVTLGGTNPGSFSITTNGCGGAVTGGGQCTVDLQFQPLTVGGNTATLTFSDDVPGDSSQSVTLTGTGTSPVVSVSHATLSFSAVTIGKLGPIQTVMLSNTGTGPLTVGGVNVAGVNPGSFAIASNTCGSTLAAGASCTVGVQFTPKLAQLLTGALKFHTTPKAQVALTGSGNPPPAVQNVRAAAGCSATLLTWKPNSSVAGFLSTVIVRRHRRAPRSPSDGLVLRPKTAGRLHDGGLRHHSTYHYALFARYRFHAGGPVVYSKPSKNALTTRRICAPMNNQLISTRTPRVSWIPFNNALGYNLQVWQGGKKIYSPQMKPAHFKIPAGHALKSGKTYTLKLYAFTTGRTHGHLRIGTSTFQTT
jgi:hypothetical protein